MRRKRSLLVALALIATTLLIFQSCAIFRGSGKKSNDTRARLVMVKEVIVYDPAVIPSTSLTDSRYPILQLSKRATLAQVEERSRTTKLFPYIVNDRHLICIINEKGELVVHRVLKGALYFCKQETNPINGVTTYIPKQSFGGDPVLGIKIVKTYAKKSSPEMNDIKGR